MRKLITWNMVTLDGFFEGPEKGQIEFHVFDDEMEKFSVDTLLNAGTLVFGRVTYEMMAAYWPSAEGQIAELMNRVPKVVFSRILSSADWANTTLLKGDVAEEVAKLKQQPGRDIFVFGSADLSSTLTQHRLIDEYWFGVNPVVLGQGIPWFKGSTDEIKLKLLQTLPLKSGVVILRYALA
jgi:dihydrofolate reductase